MVQKIKIDDNFELEFEDMSAFEYAEITNSFQVVREDFDSEEDFKKAMLNSDRNFVIGIAEKLFNINGTPVSMTTIKPYQFAILADLVKGYISDVNSKKQWDMRGWAKKQGGKEEKENTSKPSIKKKK